MFFFDEKGLFIAKLSQLFSFVTCYTDANINIIFLSSKKNLQQIFTEKHALNSYIQKLVTLFLAPCSH